MSNLENHQGGWAKILSAFLIIADFLIAFWAYPQLGDRVPSHWNLAGEVNGYSSRFGGAFMLPLILLGIYLLFWIIPKIDPKKANYPAMSRIYWISTLAIIFFLSLMHVGVLGVGLGYFTTLPRWYFSGIGILFIILGNYFGKIKFNYFFGIRTSWTLASEEVWYRTHRFAGPIWMVGGILIGVLGFMPSQWVGPLFAVAMVILVGAPTLYSYVQFKKLNF
ncbi:SdpI family protein [Desulfitobacterium sp.]|uniref:SdpI family protein n=1 Tax=Desulfitobacterium sp. TaxID=49981 RepID=UPI002B220DED|nr:SdpI family protein [Desulfitobacterium sp.]MEA4901461.1 SdpI family protein [Desulfitobacterium sp.]